MIILKQYYRDVMKDYNYKKLRNVGLIGHGATGKTSLAEALGAIYVPPMLN